ncbi:hypothetical protein SAMN02745121_05208 [Nannocystis exedens]|uniref:Uncharacterized protein n=2 Tax=Nannocystis exedens TaxID=54 RepID=A0A1I2CRB4_9BACT|nr:hypothetical protein [Nannocystis exedens]PCC68506.1 hypothetical protein NAEX_01521 [Nannocystis exedens]SFE70764.1 hypothetical protein SAMN02745121_05208 [Nannocystis exedens]
MRTIRGFCAVSICLLPACPDKESESASGSEATTTGTPTTGETMTPTEGTTTETTTTTSEGTTTEALTTTTEPTTGATTGEPLCDVDMAGFEASCEQVCEVYGSCEADVDPVACAETCKTETLFKDTPACLCSATAWNACRGALDCAGIDAVGPVASSPCFAETASYLIHCADCQVEPEFFGADMCGTIVECPDVLGVSFLCQNGTCVCNDGEADYASCPDPGVCAGMDAEALNAAASECCGIPF